MNNNLNEHFGYTLWMNAPYYVSNPGHSSNLRSIYLRKLQKISNWRLYDTGQDKYFICSQSFLRFT